MYFHQCHGPAWHDFFNHVGLGTIGRAKSLRSSSRLAFANLADSGDAYCRMLLV